VYGWFADDIINGTRFVQEVLLFVYGSMKINNMQNQLRKSNSAVISGACTGQKQGVSPDMLIEQYLSTRKLPEQIVAGMTAEDMQVQSMPDASPAKWHLAHTTWFFETFILNNVNGYQPFHEHFNVLFNSYYNSVGEQFKRPSRGVLSRPSVEEILAYRHYVDDAMCKHLAGEINNDEWSIITLGINHEQQHQELMFTDIKHAFSLNPMYPALLRQHYTDGPAQALKFISFDGGLYECGADAVNGEFCFDNETPQHQVYLAPFKLASRTVTNSEYAEFIAEGGYTNPLLWLSDGWAWIKEHQHTQPVYWKEQEGERSEFTLAGLQPLQPNAPVCHVNYYEACAYAAWAGKRLPTEFEWEVAAKSQPVEGNMLDMNVLHPQVAKHSGLTQLFGDVWEWTSSAYAAYPGYQPAHGALGEYNGKFMCGQYVLRGGSCVTPPGHIRSTYRNFFYPHSFWQFSGIRLASD
jgi:ergothioneine biosynthesis protein EgtB